VKIVKLAVATAVAASALMAGAVAMGGTASAASLSAARTTAHGAPAARPATQAAATGAWGRAHLVPGLAALNKGGGAGVNQVSCASPGNCAAVGIYTDAGHHQQVFVANEKNGTWNNALEVPGLAALNTGGGAEASGVSCASAGNCAAAGIYLDAQGHQHAFVADEKNGTWQNAHAIPGLGKLNPGGTSSATTVSCASPGNCAVGGFYETNVDTTDQAFVADEKNGTWGQAIEVPGTGALNGAGRAEVLSISCPSAGNCTAGGFYEDATISFHAFVADETGGQWGQVHTIDVTVTGITPINEERVTAVSCASAGNCAATGNAGNATGHQQVWVADEVGGTWGAPQEIPGFDSLNTGLIADAQSISCPSLGYCATGGQLSTQNGPVAYVADERAGGWDLAQQVFGGTVAFNTAVDADIESVSCGSLGNCAASGSYITTGNVRLAFVVNEVDGSWGNAQNVPGIAALAKGGLSDATSVSCAPAGNCAAGGFFRGAHGDGAFLADQATAASASTESASTESAR
jgi:hypothetical protein